MAFAINPAAPAEVGPDLLQGPIGAIEAYFEDLRDVLAEPVYHELRASRTPPGNTSLWKHGGAEGGRTPDLRIANATLSQLSYGPIKCIAAGGAGRPERAEYVCPHVSCQAPPRCAPAPEPAFIGP